MATSALQKVWVITGTSTGLGRELALAALAAGDKVIATARSLSSIASLASEAKVEPSSTSPHERLKALQLDVTHDHNALRSTAAEAVAHWGRVDVLVNNAGSGMFGVSEEVGVDGYRAQFATNFFGPLDVTHAFLPYMRKSRSGTLVFVGSRSSWRANVPLLGTYNASKAALSAAAEALGAELAPLGIRVLNVVPGGLRTNNWTNMSLLPTAPSAHLSPLYDPDCGADASISSNEPEGVKSEGGIPDYAATRNSVIAWMNAQSGTQPGDPATAARAILDVVRGEGTAANKRDTFPDMGMLALGSDAEKNIREKCERVLRNLDEWQDVVRSIDIKEKAKR